MDSNGMSWELTRRHQTWFAGNPVCSSMMFHDFTSYNSPFAIREFSNQPRLSTGGDPPKNKRNSAVHLEVPNMSWMFTHTS
jgi:hypothetical protein